MRGRLPGPPPAARSGSPSPVPTCVVEPLLQEGLEFAHVLEAQVEGLETGDGRLAEVVAIELAHGQAHVTLAQWGGNGAAVRARPSVRILAPPTGPRLRSWVATAQGGVARASPTTWPGPVTLCPRPILPGGPRPV